MDGTVSLHSTDTCDSQNELKSSFWTTYCPHPDRGQYHPCCGSNNSSLLKTSPQLYADPRMPDNADFGNYGVVLFHIMRGLLVPPSLHTGLPSEVLHSASIQHSECTLQMTRTTRRTGHPQVVTTMKTRKAFDPQTCAIFSTPCSL